MLHSIKRIGICLCLLTLVLGCGSTTRVPNERAEGGLAHKFELTFEYFSMKQVLAIYASIKHEWPGTVNMGQLMGSEPSISFSLSSKKSQAGVISTLIDLLEESGISEKDINIRAKSNRISVEYLGETAHLTSPLGDKAVIVEFRTLSRAFRSGSHYVLRHMSRHELVPMS